MQHEEGHEPIQSREVPGWLAGNFKTVLLIIGLVATIAAQWYSFGEADRRSRITEERLRLHEQDTTRHADPLRDQQLREEIIRRLESIDRRLDQLNDGRK